MGREGGKRGGEEGKEGRGIEEEEEEEEEEVPTTTLWVEEILCVFG